MTTSVEISFQQASVVKALQEARAAVKAAEAEASRLTAEVRAILGDAAQATLGGLVVAEVKSVTRTGVDTKALRTEYPEVYAKVETTTTYERIVV